MQFTLFGRTLRIGLPQVVLAGVSLTLVVAIVTAGVTATAPFAAYNADWTGTSDLRALAAEGDRAVVIGSNGTLPSTPNETVVLMIGVAEPAEENQQTMRQFVEQGGTLIVSDDTGVHSNPLLTTVGATAQIQNRPLRDPREYYRSPALPIVQPTEEADMPNVSSITLNHASIVTPHDATVMARTSQFSYVDTTQNGQFDSTESLGRRPVMTTEQVGEGKVIVISDSSVFVNAMLERPGNEQLATTLLTGYETVVLRTPDPASVPPVVNAMLVLRKSPSLQMLTLVVLVGSVMLSRHHLERARLDRDSTPASSDDPKGERDPSVNPDTDTSTRVDGFVRLLTDEHPEWDRQRLKRVVQVATGRWEDNDE